MKLKHLQLIFNKIDISTKNKIEKFIKTCTTHGAYSMISLSFHSGLLKCRVMSINNSSFQNYTHPDSHNTNY